MLLLCPETYYDSPSPPNSPQLSRRKWSCSVLSLIPCFRERLIWTTLAKPNPNVGIPTCSLCLAFFISNYEPSYDRGGGI